MWPWRSVGRFSIQEFKYQVRELQKIKGVDKLNKEFVVDIVRSIVEMVTYGDRHDSSIFEVFMEHQILSDFLRILKINHYSGIELQLLHYLSIMIQNLMSEHAIYYCFSNEYINNIILHPYVFDGGELAPYYISFLRTVSRKLNKDTLCLLVKVEKDMVVSFPLYTEAIKFARHEEKLIQAAVRAVTLSIYRISDDMVYTFLTTAPVSEYFSDLVLNLRQQCFDLDSFGKSLKRVKYTPLMRMELVSEVEKVMDDLYYLKDIFQSCDPRMSRLMIQNLLDILILPVLAPALQSKQKNGSQISAEAALYVSCRLLQVIDANDLADPVAIALLHSYTRLSCNFGTNCTTDLTCSFQGNSDKFDGNTMGIAILPEYEGTEKSCQNYQSGHLLDYISLFSHSDNHLVSDDMQNKKCGLFSLFFAENPTILVTYVIFLLVLSEIEDTKSLLSMSDLARKKLEMDQLFNVMMKVLAHQPPLSAQILQNSGWILCKLLNFIENITDSVFESFNICYKISYESLLKELSGCWLDYIPVMLNYEWESCKTALEVSSKSINPFFVLEPVLDRQKEDGDISSAVAWRRMVDAVKVFVLHLLLRSFILKEDNPKNPFRNWICGSMSISRMYPAANLLSENLGSGQGLGPKIPCKIAFSKSKEVDIYLVPVRTGTSADLLLMERTPVDTHRGVLVAVAPLAGLDPTIDENHPAWLHLRVREYKPKLETSSKTGGYPSNASFDNIVDGRWVVGFPNGEECKAARALILDEMRKQISSLESLLVPFIQST